MASLSSDRKYVTVESGDTLSEIALEYKSYISGSSNSDRVNTLKRINNISNVDYIVIGQKIYFDKSGDSSSGSSGSSSSSSSSSSNSNRPKIKAFGLQSNTDNTIYVTWDWSKSNTEHYRVRWLYATGDGVAFVGNDSTTTEKQSLYSAPSNATKVKVKIKPISKKYKADDDTEVSYWTADWSEEKLYHLKDNPPSVPAVPTVTIDGYNLTASLDNLDINANYVEFQIVKDNKSVASTLYSKIKTKYASVVYKVAAGSSYKVRCRGYRLSDVKSQSSIDKILDMLKNLKNSVYGDWSDYSSEVVAPPIAPKQIKELKAKSKTEIAIDWTAVNNVDSYDIEYTTQRRYFNSSSEVRSINIESGLSNVSHAEITGLTPGEEYFFRVRSVKGNQKSAWCEIKSIILGSKPIAPTTWSSTTTAIIGDPLNLYWVHNTEDGSSQTKAQLEIYDDSMVDEVVRSNVDATTLGTGDFLCIWFKKTLPPSSDQSVQYFVEYKKTTDADYKSFEVVPGGDHFVVHAPEVVAYDVRVRELRLIRNSTDEDEKDKTSVYTVDTTGFAEGAQLDWRVRTAGITDEYSDWSIQRTVEINAPPTLELSVTDAEGNSINTVNQFPFYIKGIPGPRNQRPIGYHVSIVSNEFYETVDSIGNLKTVNVGETVYSSYIDSIAGPNLFYYKAEHKDGDYIRTYDVVEVIEGVLIEGVKTTYGDQVYKTIIDGVEVYYYMVEDMYSPSDTLILEMSPSNVDLENNIMYTVVGTVSMNSGLTAEAYVPLTVSWTEDRYTPNAEVGINQDDWSAIIKPTCEDIKMVNYLVTQESDKYIRTDTILEDDVWDTKVIIYKVDHAEGKYVTNYNVILNDISGTAVNGATTITGDQVYVDISGTYFCLVVKPIDPIDATTETGDTVRVGEKDDGTIVMYCTVEEATVIDDVLLSVYRREFDGTFTEIIKNVENTDQTYVTDPHPALDYARYRIVATSKTTGAVSYYDLPGQPVGCNAVIIQWDEEWSLFEANTEDELVKPPWSGSLLKLPYNIDVSDKYDMDVSTVEYIGRKHPVSYYGTQLGASSTWNAVIPKDDEETLYALRRLAIWPGDVYVREPSGSGYWANISVSFSKKHLDVTIPVTLDIVRVEGGV